MLAVLLMAGSCTDTVHDFHSLPSEGWYKRSTETFTVAVPDSLARYNVSLHIRHDMRFRYQDLWLYVWYASPSLDTLLCDTVRVPVAGPDGQWLGKGWGSLYQVSVPLRYPLSILAGDSARLSVRPAMKESYLEGITEVGVSLEAQ